MDRWRKKYVKFLIYNKCLAKKRTIEKVATSKNLHKITNQQNSKKNLGFSFSIKLAHWRSVFCLKNCHQNIILLCFFMTEDWYRFLGEEIKSAWKKEKTKQTTLTKFIKVQSLTIYFLCGQSYWTAIFFDHLTSVFLFNSTRSS